MLNLFMLGALAFALSYVGVALIRRWALHRNLLDIPNERSSHVMPTPRGGGIAIAIILIAGFALARLWTSELDLRAYFGFLLGVMVVASISIIDDLFTLSARLRLFIHLFAASVFLLFSGYVGRVDLPLVGELNWGWIGVPIVLFWIVGLTNAYNFMDGIDGIAAGQAVVAGSFWIVVCWTLGLPTLTALSVLVVGASLGFLLHNTPPARIFMGDVGSTVLGYTFATLPVLAFRQVDNSRVFIAGVLCVAPFVFDAALTMLRRFLNHENILQGHRSHLYQRLVKLGYSHGAVSLLYIGLAIVTSLCALVYLWGNNLEAGLGLLAAISLLLATGAGVTWLEHRHAHVSARIAGHSLPAQAKKDS